MNIYKDAVIVFTAEDSINGGLFYYQDILMTQNCFINADGNIQFDFTMAMNTYPDANQVKVYLWNNRSVSLLGDMKLEVYEAI